MPHPHIDMSAQMRRARALQHRIQGMQWKEIAELDGYPSASAAFKAAQQMLDQHVIPAVEEYRKLSEMRLDAMLAAIWPSVVGEKVIDAETGAYLSGEIDLDCMAMALKIEARRAKLLGLDAKVDNGDFIPGQVLIREIAAPVDKV
jgi:hypothetical protein